MPCMSFAYVHMRLLKLSSTISDDFRWIKQKPFETFTPSDIVAVEHFALGVGSCSRRWTAAIS